MSTFGPVADEKRDGARLRQGIERVRTHLLVCALRDRWVTIDELVRELEAIHGTRFSWGSVDADVRHLRKQKFGGWDVRRRRRGTLHVSEYRIFAPCKVNRELTLFDDATERLGA